MPYTADDCNQMSLSWSAAGIAPDQPVDATVLSDPTWAANEAFKAKSYNVQNPASLGAISAISSALSANPAAWVQLSAFGVSSCRAMHDLKHIDESMAVVSMGCGPAGLVCDRAVR